MSKTKKKLLILIPLFIFLDQLSKNWMLSNVFDSQRIIEINKYLNFVPVWNKGISFGMLSNFMNINFFMIIVTSSIILFLFFWFQKTKNRNLSLSLSLIISGAIGNLIDRLSHKAVVDFIDFHIESFHWPAFNFADIYITIGVLIIIYANFMIFKKKYD